MRGKRSLLAALLRWRIKRRQRAALAIERASSRPLHPRAFLAEYVDPAIALYRADPLVPHLAVHAISQMDILAEVAATYTLPNGQQMLGWGEAHAFRTELGARCRALSLIRDAHDSHKHGRLRATRAANPGGVTFGQRPQRHINVTWFDKNGRRRPRPLRREMLVVTLNNGARLSVSTILDKGREAWDRELERLGL